MARGKKIENALTPEEKLAQALVPDWEQPYKVPGNWCWVKLGSVSTNQYGYTAKAIVDKSLPKMLRITDIQENGVDWNTVPNCKIEKGDLEKYLLQDNDIVIARIGATTGKSFLLDHPVNSVFASYLIRLRLSESLHSPYVYYFLQSDTCWKQISELSSGIALPGVNSSKLQTMMFPLSPFPEQQRIVDRIESLFAKLDEAKEKAQTVLDSFETRKAAILHEAFTGELTAKWREEHGVGMESWEVRTLQSVCSTKITDGTHKTPTYCDAEVGIPFISAKDVTSGEICWDNIKYITPNLHEELYARLAPQINDILLAKNGTTGVAAIVDVDKVFDLYVTLAVLRPNIDIIIPRFLLRIVNSPICKSQFDEHLTGIGVPNLHLRDIKEVRINVPTLPEQTEIVSILDSLFAKEQQAKEAAESVLEQIDLMKKSILARAFRGELGTNDPAEESAVELVKQVLSEDNAAKKPPKAPVKRTPIPAEIKKLLSNHHEEEIVRLLLKSASETVPMQRIMSISSKKFELMEALRKLEQKQLICKNETGEYTLTR